MAQVYVKSMSSVTLDFRKYNETILKIYEEYHYHLSDGSIEKKEDLCGEIIHFNNKSKFNGVLNSLISTSNMELILNKMKELEIK